jgi:1,4-alpha-glucan branching enzyme
MEKSQKSENEKESTSKEKAKKKLLPLVEQDPWLEPYEDTLQRWHVHYMTLLKELEVHYGSLYDFASSHKQLGFNYDKSLKGWHYREWAPAAESLHLIGEFNQWNQSSHPLKRREDGVWEIFLPDSEYKNTLKHESRVKILVKSAIGKVARIPAYIQRVVQNLDHSFDGQFWNPETPFSWEGDTFNVKSIKEPLIYECHVGMAQEKEGVGTYNEFTEHILPRIKKLGYNCIQMMAVQEHPYYGSFGYHVSSFFAPTSRFGTPEDLKALIKKAHSMGIAVIMDIVHSHAVKNLLEGLSYFDGTEYQYFHAGGKGDHSGWDSKLFNYGKWEVLQFLLSNVRYWLEEFHFDGFRFDGVTSMLYVHHGHASFNGYDDYFSHATDLEAVTYLKLANELAHKINPHVISIAEDVSGMPGLSRPVKEGGVGFDYRLGMGIPDFWIKMLKEKKDDDWNVWDIWGVMNNRRQHEKTIAYSESHDQALVGDKTIAFWLMDKEMYWHMNNESNNLVIDRGIALHKMIRLLTISAGGEGYLNFIGNEFGHPEWIDFPREGNGWSYKYARRQWSLEENGFLKYRFLSRFDEAMLGIIKKHKVLSDRTNVQLNIDENNHVLIFKRAELIFVFNFHPTRSIPNYKFWAGDDAEGTYQMLLNSDDADFGGHGRIDKDVVYHVDDEKNLLIYSTNRTAFVLGKKK